MEKLYARFQGSEDIEYNSRYTLDIFDIFDNKLTLEDALKYHRETLSMRKGILPEDLAAKIIDCKTDKEKDEILNKYPLEGVFAYDIDYFIKEGEINSPSDMLKLPGFYEIALKPRYLVILEGRKIKDFKEGAVLIKATKVIDTYDVFNVLKNDILSYNNFIKRFKNKDFLLENNILIENPKDDDDLYYTYLNLVEISEDMQEAMKS